MRQSRPVRLRTQVSKRRTAHELRVMTFNLRVRTILDGHNIWDRRRDLVVERVRAFDPDLLGTQEGLDSMETFLRQQFGDYTFRGVGRNDGKQRGEMCGVFFKTARFELLDGGHFWLSTTPEKPGSRGWGAIFPRMVTWVKLRPRDGGATVLLVQHALRRVQRTRAHAVGEAAARSHGTHRRRDAVHRHRRLQHRSRAPRPTARCSLAERQPRASSLHDVFRAAHPVATREEGTVHFFTGWRGGRRMDWILASSHFQTIDADIDHTRGPARLPIGPLPRHRDATRPRRHCTAAAGDAARIAEGMKK